MILCLDAGNTRLKFGLHDGQRWLVQAALATADWADQTSEKTVDNVVNSISAQLPARPTRLLACSVAGPAMHQLIEALGAHFALAPEWLRSEAAAFGLRNTYARPTQLGHDRWAALIGARGLCADACVVVMAGTATTIDALAADGTFRGGLILPGLTLMRQALAGATAQLPFATGRYQAWPDNTDDAIVSGALAATVGAIERLRGQLASLTRPSAPSTHDSPATQPARCVLSGGAAEALSAHLAAPLIWQPELVLEGLLCSALAADGVTKRVP